MLDNNHKKIYLQSLILCILVINFYLSPAQELNGLAKTAAFSIKGKNKKPENQSQSKNKLDFKSSRIWPGVTLHSLLGPEGLQMSLDGQLRIPNITFSFLPPKLKDGTMANYNGYQKKDILLTAKVINTSTGEEAGEFHYTVNPYSKTFSYSNQQTAERRGFAPAIQLTDGTYEIQFYGTSIHFFSFYFEVEKLSSSDPYAVFDEVYFLKGPWESWAYLTIDDNNKALRFHFYEENDNPDVENEFRQTTQKEITYQAKIYKGHKLIGGSGNREKIEVKSTYTIRSKWVESNTQFIHIAATISDQKQILPEELGDGDYRIELEVNDALGKNTKTTFPFSLKNGKLIGDSQATRGSHGNKFTFLEPGGRAYTFIKSNGE